jgi:hypothetical protein
MDEKINARLRRRHGGLVRSEDDDPRTQSLKDANATRSVFWNNITSMQSWHKGKERGVNALKKARTRRRRHR